MSNDPVKRLVEAQLKKGARCFVDRGGMLYVTDDKSAHERLARLGFMTETRGDWLAIGLSSETLALVAECFPVPEDACVKRLLRLRERPVCDGECSLLMRALKGGTLGYAPDFDVRFRRMRAVCLRTHTGGALWLCRAIHLYYTQYDRSKERMKSMQLQWLGHSCFVLTNALGHTLMTDPFDASVGYRVPTGAVDVVLTSHDHFDHNHIEQLDPGYTLINSAGSYDVAGFHIETIASFHDDVHGAKRGVNLLSRITFDGVTVMHLGDLGHMPDAAQAAFLRGADILLVPVGGVFTIDGAQAAQLVKDAAPRIAIPMHYKTRELTFAIADERAFTDAFAQVTRRKTDTIDLARLDELAPITVLSYKG